jgi:tetratricopeptide (TPR) repeat protein
MDAAERAVCFRAPDQRCLLQVSRSMILELGDAAPVTLLVDLADALTAADDHDAARDVSRRAMALAPATQEGERRIAGLRRLTDMLLRMDRADEALAILDTIKEEPGRSDVLYPLLRLVSSATAAKFADRLDGIVPMESRLRAYRRIADIQAKAGDTAGAKALLARYESGLASLPSAKMRAFAFVALADSKALLGDSAAARAALGRALLSAQAIDDPVERALMLKDLAGLFRHRGAGEIARDARRRAIDAARALPEPDARLQLYLDFAHGEWSLKRVEAAKRWVTEAESIAPAIVDPGKRRKAFEQLAISRIEMGDRGAARRLLGASDAAARRIADPERRSDAHAQNAQTWGAVDSAARRRAAAGRARDAAAQIADPGRRSHLLIVTNVLFAGAVEKDGEHDAIDRAMTTAEAHRDAVQGFAGPVLIEAMTARGRFADARKIALMIDDLAWRSHWVANIGYFAHAQDRASASALFDEALAIASTAPAVESRFGAIVQIAEYRSRLGDRDEARRLLGHALMLADVLADATQRGDALAAVLNGVTQIR